MAAPAPEVRLGHPAQVALLEHQRRHAVARPPDPLLEGSAHQHGLALPPHRGEAVAHDVGDRQPPLPAPQRERDVAPAVGFGERVDCLDATGLLLGVMPEFEEVLGEEHALRDVEGRGEGADGDAPAVPAVRNTLPPLQILESQPVGVLCFEGRDVAVQALRGGALNPLVEVRFNNRKIRLALDAQDVGQHLAGVAAAKRVVGPAGEGGVERKEVERTGNLPHKVVIVHHTIRNENFSQFYSESPCPEDFSCGVFD